MLAFWDRQRRHVRNLRYQSVHDLLSMGKGCLLFCRTHANVPEAVRGSRDPMLQVRAEPFQPGPVSERRRITKPLRALFFGRHTPRLVRNFSITLPRIAPKGPPRRNVDEPLWALRFGRDQHLSVTGLTSAVPRNH